MFHAPKMDRVCKSICLVIKTQSLSLKSSWQGTITMHIAKKTGTEEQKICSYRKQYNKKFMFEKYVNNVDKT
jgi:hypothetical protein